MDQEYDFMKKLLELGPQSPGGYGPQAPMMAPTFEVTKKVKQPALAEPIVAAFGQRQKFPTSLEEFTSLINRQTEGLSGQREGLKQIESQIAELQKPQESSALAPILMAASDLMSGTQFMKGYQTPEQKDQARKAQALGLQMQMQKAKGDLTDKEIDLFKAQYQDARDREKMAQEENMFKAKLGADMAKGSEKLLTASETEQLADLKDQMGSLDNIYTDWSTKVGATTGVGDYLSSKATGYMPNTEVSNYKTNLKQKAQLIGKALEGGKLTDVDYEKYLDFLPQPGDTDERARARVNNLKKALQQKYTQRVKTFGEAGYKMGGFTPIENKPLTTDQKSGVMSFEEWKKARGSK